MEESSGSTLKAEAEPEPPAKKPQWRQKYRKEQSQRMPAIKFRKKSVQGGKSVHMGSSNNFYWHGLIFHFYTDTLC